MPLSSGHSPNAVQGAGWVPPPEGRGLGDEEPKRLTSKTEQKSPFSRPSEVRHQEILTPSPSSWPSFRPLGTRAPFSRSRLAGGGRGAGRCAWVGAGLGRAGGGECKNFETQPRGPAVTFLATPRAGPPLAPGPGESRRETPREAVVSPPRERPRAVRCGRAGTRRRKTCPRAWAFSRWSHCCRSYAASRAWPSPRPCCSWSCACAPGAPGKRPGGLTARPGGSGHACALGPADRARPGRPREYTPPPP